MRVHFLLDNFLDDDATGAVFFRLCQRWIPHRELTLAAIAFGEDGPLKERLESLGVSTMLLPWKGLRHFRDIREAGKRVLYSADRPDVLVSLCRWPDLPARFFHYGHRDVPLIASLHEMDFCKPGATPEPFLRRTVERFTRKRVTAYICTCARQEVELARRGIPKDKLFFIPMGVDGLQCFPIAESNKERFRSLLGVESSAPLLIATGRFAKGQGHEDLLRAMPQVVRRYPEVRLFLIGDGPLRSRFEHMTQELGVAEQVRLIGHLSAVTAKLFSTADIVIHTIQNEPFSLTIAEAQASGTPVVAYRSGGNEELVRHGRTGLLVPPGSSTDLADTILTLLDDADLRTAMGEAAREAMLEHHEIGESADRYVRLWRQLAPNALWKTTTSVHIEDLEEFKREAAGEG